MELLPHIRKGRTNPFPFYKKIMEPLCVLFDSFPCRSKAHKGLAVMESIIVYFILLINRWS